MNLLTNLAKCSTLCEVDHIYIFDITEDTYNKHIAYYPYSTDLGYFYIFASCGGCTAPDWVMHPTSHIPI